MIPAFAFAPNTNNQRVSGFEMPGDESPRVFSNDTALSSTEKQMVIRAAYLQIFHQQQMLQSSRMVYLESQFINGQLTVRDFIRGLLLSDPFRRLNFDCNNNYRFVELCIQRVLGRETYNHAEKLSWSIVLGTAGLSGFIDLLLNSDEYLENFGFQTVPYHRQRILPQHTMGELPFQRMARYGEAYRDQIPTVRSQSPLDRSANVYQQILILPIIAGLLLILSIFVSLVI